MVSPSRLVITELDFDDIKNNLLAFLQSQSTFQDYNFQASGLQVLINELAYNDHYLAYYCNMIANEMNLGSALIRDNINLKAKELNYIPRSMTAPTAIVNIAVTPTGGNIAPTLLLPQYTPFQSQAINGQNFTYVTPTGYIAPYNPTTNQYLFANVQIKEGEVVQYAYAASATNPRNTFNIPSANIDTSTLIVNVTEHTPSPPATYPYAACTDVSLLTGNSRVFFIEGASSNTYNMYFGDGILGKALTPGDVAVATYLVTFGTLSNGANSFTCMAPIGGYGNVITYSVSGALGGADAETNDSIRYNAPLAYSTQNRAVTVSDYAFLIARDFPGIGSINVWGGDQNNPPVFGVPFISIKPSIGLYLSPIVKQAILTQIQNNYAIPGVVPQIVDPDYTNLNFTVNVNYNPNRTQLSQNQLITAIQSAVSNYATTRLGTFNATYRESDVISYVMAADPSILGCDVSVTLQKQFYPTLGQSRNYTLNFYTSLLQGGPTDKMYSSPGVTLLDSFGNPRECFIEENINTYQGIASIFVNNPGFGFTGTPTVTIQGDGTGALAHAVIVNSSVQSIVLDSPGQGYTFATAQITGGGGFNAAITPVIGSQIGIIDVFYYTNTNKIVINPNIGTVDHLNGIVNLNNFAPIGIDNNAQLLSINAKPKTNIILPSRNNVLVFDTVNSIITVNLLPQTS